MKKTRYQQLKKAGGLKSGIGFEEKTHLMGVASKFDQEDLDTQYKNLFAMEDMAASAKKGLDKLGVKVASGKMKPQVKATIGKKKPTAGLYLDKVKEGLPDVVPFISNVVNSFRRPAKPKLARAASGVPVRQVRQSIQPITDAVRTAQVNANRNLDENTAAAVGQQSFVRGLDAIGQQRTQEAQLNAQLAAQADVVNNRTDMINSANQQEFYDNETGRQLIDATQQSANWANAADKLVALRSRNVGTENQKMQLDMLMQADPWGTQERFAPRMADTQRAVFGNRKLGGPVRRVSYERGGPLKPPSTMKKFDSVPEGYEYVGTDNTPEGTRKLYRRARAVAATGQSADGIVRTGNEKDYIDKVIIPSLSSGVTEDELISTGKMAAGLKGKYSSYYKPNEDWGYMVDAPGVPAGQTVAKPGGVMVNQPPYEDDKYGTKAQLDANGVLQIRGADGFDATRKQEIVNHFLIQANGWPVKPKAIRFWASQNQEGKMPRLQKGGKLRKMC